jgi:hypothetical protein
MKKHLPLIALLLIGLLAGLFLLPGYGESTDELSQRSYAERTIQAVKSLVPTRTLSSFFFEEEPKQGSHGPAFMMAVVLLRDLLQPEGTSIQRLQLSHFLYYLMFLVGMASFFFLVRRWVGDMAAVGATLLMSTQPLLLGHAFMNPKDIVFMSLFIASTTTGLWMLDRSEGTPPHPNRSFKDGARSFFRQFLYADVWLAGLLLGFSSAVRMAAPLVGLVLLAYILLTRRWGLLPRFLAYGVIALCSMVLFWPYLWPDPLGRLVASFENSAQYPDIHETLFRGALIDSRNTPLLYLPLLMLIQLTESTLLLIGIGIYPLLKKHPWDLISLIVVWFVLPVVAIALMRVNLYNNFRQVFFLLPPLFLLAGLGLDWLFKFIHRSLFRIVLIGLFLLPGLYANVRLYPYQYIYYNQLVGGLQGAYRSFEMDYWNLGYKEALSYVNQTAETGANVFVGDAKSSAQAFARADLVLNALGGRKANWGNYDYIVVSTAQNADEKFSEFPTVFVVEREGTPLVFVKKPQ